MDRGRDGAMVCAGQQRLEAHVWRALRDYSRDVGDASVAATASGWKAAATGSCLHLSVDSITASLLMSVLTPVLDGPPTTATLHGCPGLRGAGAADGQELVAVGGGVEVGVEHIHPAS